MALRAKKWWLASLLLVSGLLPALAQKPSGPTRAARPFVGYHRYRGTVGGHPVTVELNIDPDPEKPAAMLCRGSYYYGRHPASKLLLHSPLPWRPRLALTLDETEADTTHQPTGRWLATQPAGPVLSGTWRSPAGQALPFSLREDYTDGQGHLMAAKYEIVEAAAKVPCRPERKEDETAAEYRKRIATIDHGYSQLFLHLRGPDTLRPALRGLQCLAPVARRRLARAAAAEDDGCKLYSTSLTVDYNDYGLLAWTEYSMEEFANGARPSHGIASMVHDLHTGEALRLEDIVRPDTDTLLQRLITRSILRRDNSDIWSKPGAKMPVHAADMAPLSTSISLTAEGLSFAYQCDEFAQLSFIEGSAIVFSVPVPWAELLPLLRPDSPVARMLRERGLWPPARR
jgi:hypothetical protein